MKNGTRTLRTALYEDFLPEAGISNYIPQFIVGSNYSSLHNIPASGKKDHI